jgi:hypothetical protein
MVIYIADTSRSLLFRLTRNDTLYINRIYVRYRRRCAGARPHGGIGASKSLRAFYCSWSAEVTIRLPQTARLSCNFSRPISRSKGGAVVRVRAPCSDSRRPYAHILPHCADSHEFWALRMLPSTPGTGREIQRRIIVCTEDQRFKRRWQSLHPIGLFASRYDDRSDRRIDRRALDALHYKAHTNVYGGAYTCRCDAMRAHG